jgi:uncharacterized DUF497 family protein
VVNWGRFIPADFEYDFERDKLAAHNVTFEEAVECFFLDFEVRRNRKYRDRYQLIARTVGGRRLKIIFQIKPGKHRSNHYGVAAMSSRAKNTTRLSEEETDRIVTAQANDNSAWEKPVRVRRARRASLSLPGDLAARASFLARLHRKASVEQWLTHIIQERIELEEAAFAGAKHDLAEKAE